LIKGELEERQCARMSKYRFSQLIDERIRDLHVTQCSWVPHGFGYFTAIHSPQSDRVIAEPLTKAHMAYEEISKRVFPKGQDHSKGPIVGEVCQLLQKHVAVLSKHFLELIYDYQEAL
jgi:hypothetical protein